MTTSLPSPAEHQHQHQHSPPEPSAAAAPLAHKPAQTQSQSQPHPHPQPQAPTQTNTAPGTYVRVPGQPQNWSVDDVCRWAQSQALVAPVVDTLREHAVDGHVLINYVTNTVLAEELGIAAFGTRVHILEAIETLRWNTGMCAKAARAS
ncbi:hypothetical protein LPJ66_011469, partial [Kickxella alabastrina]